MISESAGWQPTIEEVYNFLGSVKYCVVSTLDKSGQPQTATVAFSQTKDLKFIIGTADTSRKARNLKKDNRIALVATDLERRYTVQVDGTAERLSPDEFDKYAEAHFKKLPNSAPFRDVKGQCYFLISPHWLRFSDCSVYPWVLTEIPFNANGG